MANFLEQLVAEWYEYKGYFVRRNVLVGPRPNGGYEGELDVVAFHPENKHLVHIEASMDTLSYEQREKRFRKKFDLGRKHIPKDIFKRQKEVLEQIALLEFASYENYKELGGGQLKLVSKFLSEIFEEIKSKHISRQAIPEHLSLLRALQFVASHRKEVFGALNNNR